MEYTEVFRNLTYQTACVIFVKKNGDNRVMLATRNLNTVALKYGFQGMALGGHDNRCNIKNGNIAVIDLVKGEARSFNIDRLVKITYYGELKTVEELDKAAEEFLKFKTQYESTIDDTLTMDSLD